MSGWNDGGRGERGNRRVFDPTQDPMTMREEEQLGRAFSPARLQKEESGSGGGCFERCGLDIRTRWLTITCLTY